MERIPLYSSKEIYRPLWERDSAFLEVTTGCSWHRCAFCDFVNDPFEVFSLAEIEEKAILLAQIAKDKHRVFLLGENPFMLSTNKLMAILDIIHRHLPWIAEISMYARSDDIIRKSDTTLTALRKEGVVHLHIGLESGCDEVLKQMNKGVTSMQVKAACELLLQCQISYAFTIITGLGGKERSKCHVQDTISLLNITQPAALWINGLRVWPYTPLKNMLDNGQLNVLSPYERFLETYEILQNLELKNCLFADTTVMEKYTLLGVLPQNKKSLLTKARQIIAAYHND